MAKTHEKYGWLPRQVEVLSPCVECRHFYRDVTCKAFPKGIPEKILDGIIKHRKPFPGDRGIQFEPLKERL